MFRRQHARARQPAVEGRGRVQPQRDWLGGLYGVAAGQDAFDLVEGGGVAVQVAVLAGDSGGEALRLTLSRDTRTT